MTTARPMSPLAPNTSRLAALLGLLALLTVIPSAQAAATSQATTPKPTIVLVHGAWAGPEGWDEVAAGLQKDGYPTVTPTLDELSVDGDVATVRSALDAIPGDKLLVGHSYGGFVISNAAFGRSDVLGLVYLAAFVPDEGDSILTLGAGYTPPAALAHLLFTGAPFASPAYIDPAYFHEDFAQDLSPQLAALLNAQQRPINAPILFTPSGPGAWHTLPSWYAVCGLDRMVDPALQRALAQRIGATTVEFDEASHAGGFTHYSTRFVKLVEQAAEATAN